MAAEASSTPTVAATMKAYLALTKPRIVELLLVTTIPAMFLAAGRIPEPALVAVTLIGGAMSAAGANSFNSIIDRDIDEQMRRTRRRPMVRHLIPKRSAYAFAWALTVASTLILGLGANWLSAGLALLATAYYVFVYTLWLKRTTPSNIVWGGIAGCFPPLIGWTAVTDAVAWPPLILFLIVFWWTPPHTWALGLRYRDDYAGAAVPMLPVVKEAPYVTRQILVYPVLMIATSLLLWPVAGTGWLYPVVAGAMGVWILVEAVRLDQRARAGQTDAALQPMRLFHASNTYLAVVFLAAALDPLIS